MLRSFFWDVLKLLLWYYMMFFFRQNRPSKHVANAHKSFPTPVSSAYFTAISYYIIVTIQPVTVHWVLHIVYPAWWSTFCCRKLVWQHVGNGASLCTAQFSRYPLNFCFEIIPPTPQGTTKPAAMSKLPTRLCPPGFMVNICLPYARRAACGQWCEPLYGLGNSCGHFWHGRLLDSV